MTTPKSRLRDFGRLALALAMVGLWWLGPVPSAGAGAVIDVTTLSDELNFSPPCSLREAVRSANMDSAQGGCTAGTGPDTITLPPGTYTLTRQGSDEDATAGDLDIDYGGVTITGAGAGATIIDGAWAASPDRILDVNGGSLTMSGVTIRDGQAGFGAGIYLYDFTDLNLSRSVVTSNDAASFGIGGGIFGSDATVSLTEVTIDGNSAGYGGGLGLTLGEATLTDLTVTGNSAAVDGGGLSTSGAAAVNLNGVTVAGNTADSDAASGGNGGGIFISGVATLNVRNTILADNQDLSADPLLRVPDCSGAMTSQGHNLVEDAFGCTGITGPGDITAQDPLLGPLADNGGPTPTQALAAGSPAVDAGAPGGGLDACAPTDQRGVPRSLGGACDIGAYELVSCFGVAVNRVGTEGNDVLAGTDGADGFLALGGNDAVSGQGGNDGFCLGDGDDAADGGPGNDKGQGGGGNDSLKGSAGNDLLKGEQGKDVLNGGSGKDKLLCGPGKDKVKGGPGRDKAKKCEKGTA